VSSEHVASELKNHFNNVNIVLESYLTCFVDRNSAACFCLVNGDGTQEGKMVLCNLLSPCLREATCEPVLQSMYV
jgi:hypothetical protein